MVHSPSGGPVASEISGWPLSALLTVATETPHSCARSFRDDISSSSSQEPVGSERILNRFRNFNIAHSVPKIKFKIKSFVLNRVILAVCSIVPGSNYAVCSIFGQFRCFSNEISFRCFVNGRSKGWIFIITLYMGNFFPDLLLWAVLASSPSPPNFCCPSCFMRKKRVASFKIITKFLQADQRACFVGCVVYFINPLAFRRGIDYA